MLLQYNKIKKKQQRQEKAQQREQQREIERTAISGEVEYYVCVVQLYCFHSYVHLNTQLFV